jgi:uncharacterized protein YcbK (DUF882 family)
MITWITDHFRLDEFRCSDGTPVPEKYYENVTLLCRELELIRAAYARPVTILSGYRSPKYNAAIGGAKNSFHMKGMAADIVVAGVSASNLYKQISYMINHESPRLYNGGVGRYKNFVHYDIRAVPARWNG